MGIWSLLSRNPLFAVFDLFPVTAEFASFGMMCVLIAIVSCIMHCSRWEAIAEYFNRGKPEQVHRSVDDLCNKAKETNLLFKHNGVGMNPRDGAAAKDEQKASPTPASAPAPAAAAATSSASSAVNNEWSKEQQAALEAALKQYPTQRPASAGAPSEASSDENQDYDRWTLIASAVPGKTKKQCMDRFKEVRAQIQNAGGAKNK